MKPLHHSVVFFFNYYWLVVQYNTVLFHYNKPTRQSRSCRQPYLQRPRWCGLGEEEDRRLRKHAKARERNVLSATVAFVLANVWLAAGYETVYVSRHCARSTPTTVYGGPSDYQYMDNFSSSPFPSWGVDTYLCLPRGIQIVETFGKNLRKAGFPMPFKTTSDTAQRDKTTAKALLTGLGLPVDYDVQPSLFNPTESGVQGIAYARAN